MRKETRWLALLLVGACGTAASAQSPLMYGMQPYPPYPYPYPYYYYPPPPVVYTPPPVVIQEAPPVYVQQAPPPAAAPSQSAELYWYYCQSANGYYPTVSSCPEAWVKVPPRP